MVTLMCARLPIGIMCCPSVDSKRRKEKKTVRIAGSNLESSLLSCDLDVNTYPLPCPVLDSLDEDSTHAYVILVVH